MKRNPNFLLTALFVLIAAAGHAVEEPRSGPIPPSLDEIIVSATKTEEKIKDIPNAVILINAETIQESSARNLGELLADELGIDWRSYGDYGGSSGTIQIRGMSDNGTQILINGVNAASPSLGTADVSKIPLNNIERIEVVKGSGSLLYGSGAMGGTVNIITKNPKKEQVTLKGASGFGSQNTYELTAENGMFLSKDFGYFLTAGRRETDGFRDNSDLTHTDVSMKLLWDKGDLLNLSLYGDWIDREYGRPGAKPPDGIQDYSVG
ncbi:MAG: TonB-dependent receptor plug domain-containing protein, partial [Thermodesulfobacteriota bacterium]